MEKKVIEKTLYINAGWDKREVKAMYIWTGEEHGSKDGINKKIGGSQLELGNHAGRSSWLIILYSKNIYN